jgi:hypothetical protein
MPHFHDQRVNEPIDSGNSADAGADETPIRREIVRALAACQLTEEEIAARLQVQVECLEPYKEVIAEGRHAGHANLKIKAHQVVFTEGHPGMMKFLMINELGYADDPVLAEQRRVNTQVTKQNHERELRKNLFFDEIVGMGTPAAPVATKRRKRGRTAVEALIRKDQAFDDAEE